MPENPLPHGSEQARALLDAAASPMHPQARETLLAAVELGWADPRRLYREARVAAGLIDRARETIAADLGVAPERLSFHMGGGAAALAAGLDGLRHARRRTGARVVASAVEHSALLIPARHAALPDPGLLAEVAVHADGTVDLAAWEEAVRVPGTAVAALQHANGEVGTRQPLAAAAQTAAQAGVPLLVDGTAGVGRVQPPEVPYAALAADAATVAGPPLGLLVLPAHTHFRRSGHAREVEQGLADNPVWAPLAMAAAEAWQQAAAVREGDNAAAWDLTARLREGAAAIPDVQVVGSAQERLPHIVTLSALYVDGESLIHELDRRGIALASGSACTSSTLEPSHVLAAMGALTHGNVRITLPWEAVVPGRAAAVERLLTELPAVISQTRAHLGVSDL